MHYQLQLKGEKLRIIHSETTFWCLVAHKCRVANW